MFSVEKTSASIFEPWQDFTSTCRPTIMNNSHTASGWASEIS